MSLKHLLTLLLVTVSAFHLWADDKIPASVGDLKKNPPKGRHPSPTDESWCIYYDGESLIFPDLLGADENAVVTIYDANGLIVTQCEITRSDPVVELCTQSGVYQISIFAPLKREYTGEFLII